MNDVKKYRTIGGFCFFGSILLYILRVGLSSLNIVGIIDCIIVIVLGIAFIIEKKKIILYCVCGCNILNIYYFIETNSGIDLGVSLAYIVLLLLVLSKKKTNIVIYALPSLMFITAVIASAVIDSWIIWLESDGILYFIQILVETIALLFTGLYLYKDNK